MELVWLRSLVFFLSKPTIEDVIQYKIANPQPNGMLICTTERVAPSVGIRLSPVFEIQVILNHAIIRLIRPTRTS